MRGLFAVLLGLVAVLALLEACDARNWSGKQGSVQQMTESLREDITNPKVCRAVDFSNWQCASSLFSHTHHVGAYSGVQDGKLRACVPGLCFGGGI